MLCKTYRPVEPKVDDDTLEDKTVFEMACAAVEQATIVESFEN